MTSCDIYFTDAPRFFGLVWAIIGPMLNEDTRSKITFTQSSDPSWLPRKLSFSPPRTHTDSPPPPPPHTHTRSPSLPTSLRVCLPLSLPSNPPVLWCLRGPAC